MWRLAKRIGVLLIILILFSAAGALVIVQTSAFQQWLLHRAENIAATAGYPLTAQKLDLDIWKLQASLEGITYDDKKGTRVTVDRFLVDIPRNALSGDIIRITNLEADGVSIEIRSGEALAPEPSGEKAEASRILFERVAIRNGSLTYSNQNTTIRIPSFNVVTLNGRGALRLGSPVTISPNVQLTLPDLALEMSDQSVDFGPSGWQFENPDVRVTGSIGGSLRWLPSLALNIDYSTSRFSYQNWRDLESSGSIVYADDVLKLTRFRATAGPGQVEGTAEISDQSKSANMRWSSVNLDPAGFPAVTDGTLQLQWKASDFSDASGGGSIQLNSRQYGRAQSTVTIKGSRANLNITADAFDARLRAGISTGLDQKLSGTFEAMHNKYGVTRLQGSLGGSFKDPQADAMLTARSITYNGMGPIDASAHASLKARAVSVDDLQVRYKNSSVPRGYLHLNLDNQNVIGEIPEIQAQLADFIPGATGSATLSLAIDGTIQKPGARVAGSSDGFDITGTHIDRAEITGELAGDEFHLTGLTARQGEGILKASGNYNLTTEVVGGNAQISNLQIVQIRDLSTTVSLEASLQGAIRSPSVDFNGRLQNVVYQGLEHGNLDVRGTTQGDLLSAQVQSDKYMAAATAEIRLREPYAFTAAITANQTQVQYQRYDVTANGRVQASGQATPFRAEQLSFDNFTVRGAGVDLMASGSLMTGVSVNATADLAQLPVEGTQLSGHARVKAVLSGTIEDPRIEGAVETSDAKVQTFGMTEPASIQAAVDFTRNEFIVRQYRAVFAGATVDLTGRGTLQGTGQFQFRADNIKPEQFVKDRPIAGVVSLEGSVDVARPSPEGISGSVKVTQFDLNVRDVAIHQVQPIEIAVQDQIATIRNFTIEGLETRATISGSTNLRKGELNFNVDGNTDLKLLEVMLPGSNAQGQIRTSIAIRGTTDQPNLEGFLNAERMQLQIIEPPISLTDTNVEIQFRGDRIQITKAAGGINGGEFTASGGTDVSSAGLANTAIELNLMRAQTEYPEGFQSEISSQLALNGSSNNLEITGNVDVLSGVYQQDIDLTQEVFSRITAAQTGFGAPSENQGSIDDIRLNITVGTPGVVSITNNLANFDLEGFFRLRGTIGNPIITGRAMVAEGGELYFGPKVGNVSSTELERRDRYVIAEGTIDFNNPIRTEPSFNFVATRELEVTNERGEKETYTITLRATGTAEKPKTELTSDPSLPEPDIVSMLLTGRRIDQLQGNELNVAREQFANYLSGQFSGAFKSAGSAFGLDTVQLDPVLLAGDEDLSAKLTMGKNITKDFGLIYSQNLSGPRSQTWSASYKATKDFLIRGINKSDANTLIVDLRHDLKWGGGPPLPSRIRLQNETVLGEVSFEGTSVPVKDLLKQVTKPGKPYNTYRMNVDVRKLQRFFTGQDFLDVKIRAERNPRDGTVNLRFIVNEGPKITFAFEDAKVPKNIQQEIKQIWIRGIAEGPSLQLSRARLLRYFRDEGYLQAMVSFHDVSPSTTSRRFVFDVSRGSKFKTPEWIFMGIEPIEFNATAGTTMENPKAIKDRIEYDLRKDGYLDASSSEPKLAFEGTKARFEITVERGPRYSIGKVTANVAPSSADSPHPLPQGEAPIADRLPLSPGEGGQKPGEGIFTSSWLDTARQTVIGKYWESGFNDVQVVPETEIRRRETAVDVTFKIDEGEQQIITDIRIEGYKTTNLGYILRQFTFKEGDPVDYSRVNLTRKKLYDTRLFRRVELNVVKETNGYVAETKLNENPPWNFRYGFAVTNQLQTSDRELGLTTDFSYTNLLGKGITAGVSTKYDAGHREIRTFGSLPALLGRDVKTTAALFRTRDTSDPTFNLDLWGFTLQQQWRLHNSYVLSYDYSYKRNRSVSKILDPDNPLFFPIIFPIARFNGTLSRDTRDDVLNARRGTFFSNSFEVAPPNVGSSLEFLKNYTQYLRFQPIKERMVWASAVRIAFGKGFHGEDLIDSEKYRAGGGTTVRSFKQDELTPLAGNGLLILNQELRFPILWRFSGVTFFDVGNVYSRIRDFNPFRLRYSPGFGIRIETPFVLVRFDLGFNIFSRENEDKRRFSFGIGQAF